MVTTLLPTSASKPVAITPSPLSGSEYREGGDGVIQSQSTDKSRIVRVELIVDGPRCEIGRVAGGI